MKIGLALLWMLITINIAMVTRGVFFSGLVPSLWGCVNCWQVASFDGLPRLGILAYENKNQYMESK